MTTVNGQLVESLAMKSGQNKIQLSIETPGTYLITLRSVEGISTTKKVVIK